MWATISEHPFDIAVLHLKGELDSDTASHLRRTLGCLLERPVPRIVVDLSELKFCDSVGLSSFVVGKEVIDARGGWLCFAGANPFLLQLMQTVGLNRYFATYPAVQAAIEATHPGRELRDSGGA